MTTCINLRRTEIMDWRNAERAHTLKTLSERMEPLLLDLRARVDGMTKRQLVLTAGFRGETIDPIVATWIAQQDDDLRRRIELSAREDAQRHPETEDVDAITWPEMLHFGAGAVLGVAPIAAIPFVAGAATVTTGFLITTVTFNPVVLGAAAVGALGVTLAGAKIRDRAVESVRNRFWAKLSSRVVTRVMGDPARPDAPSLARTLLADIDTLAQIRMKALA